MGERKVIMKTKRVLSGFFSSGLVAITILSSNVYAQSNAITTVESTKTVNLQAEVTNKFLDKLTLLEKEKIDEQNELLSISADLLDTVKENNSEFGGYYIDGGKLVIQVLKEDKKVNLKLSEKK